MSTLACNVESAMAVRDSSPRKDTTCSVVSLEQLTEMHLPAPDTVNAFRLARKTAGDVWQRQPVLVRQASHDTHANVIQLYPQNTSLSRCSHLWMLMCIARP